MRACLIISNFCVTAAKPQAKVAAHKSYYIHCNPSARMPGPQGIFFLYNYEEARPASNFKLVRGVPHKIMVFYALGIWSLNISCLCTTGMALGVALVPT